MKKNPKIALGDPAGARRFLDEAEPHNREHVGYYLTRGDLLVRWGEPALAIEAFLRRLADDGQPRDRTEANA